MHEPLVCKNVTINGRRTSMRLEPTMWALLEEITEREGVILNVLVSRIEKGMRQQTNQEINLTAGVRLFALGYFRAAATEDGHSKAGHGGGAPLAELGMQPQDTGREGLQRRQKPSAAAFFTASPTA